MDSRMFCRFHGVVSVAWMWLKRPFTRGFPHVWQISWNWISGLDVIEDALYSWIHSKFEVF